MSLTLLIDADVLLYQSALAAEEEIDWGGDLWTLHSNMGEARDQLMSAVDTILDNADTTIPPIMALSDDKRGYFRKRVYPNYKSNRKARRKPLVFRPLREFVEKEYKTYVKPSLEGDDVLGILATHPKLVKGDKAIVSIDKDMGTIPALWTKDGRDYTLTSQSEANHFHMIQTLTGDTTDGYGGCPSIGPKRAGDILEGLTTYAEMWPVVVEQYEKKGLTEEDALVMARLARILRAEDYDFMEQEVVLWTPPSR